MSKGIVVSVATDSWVKGQNRLKQALSYIDQPCLCWTQSLPKDSPPHRSDGLCAGAEANCVPYAFKAYAMKEAADRGHKLLLWADASILPLQSMDSLWTRIERDGYWICKNGYSNDQWTADSAYPNLFPQEFRDFSNTLSGPGAAYEIQDRLYAINEDISHVVATTFGLNIDHPKGREFLDEYFRLASQTRAFCGPWWNSNAPNPGRVKYQRQTARCGPPTTLGHRHDQTAASVIAWRLGMILDEPPKVFAYDGGQTKETTLVARAF